MLSVLHDYRFGQVQTFNEYKKNNRRFTALEIKNTWAAVEDKTMYKYMHSKGKFSYNLAELAAFNKSEEELEKHVGLKNEAISERVSILDGINSNGGEEYGSRNLVLQLFLTIETSYRYGRRFKGSHMSLETGQVESGSYGTPGRFIKGMEQYIQETDKAPHSYHEQHWAGLRE
jgi:hypothetical protein